ncbi:MAG TPA: penicillin-binding transpeptidase domain-containing protein [Candidatus Eisenbacteria bacterium]|nr:penicillin-binding transpeptidase domain-containing protein [Candidatus Eisenbacteria bacterium]
MKVGPVFFESIHSEKIPKRNHYYPNNESSVRYWLFPLIIIGLLGLLAVRLGFLQILRGDYYRTLSDSNRIRNTVIHAPRGVIFDRFGKPLVINTPGYREVVNGKTKLIDSTDAISHLAKNDTHLEIDSLRQYPCQDACAHVVGYVGQISPEDIKNPLYSSYKATDVIGKMGIESYYEPVLKGIDGAKLTEVDATGKTLRVLGQTDPLPGQNITLTVDMQLQEAVATAMKDVKKGAAIVSTPQGEILALFSSPSFDPNLFTMGKTYSPSSGDLYKSVEQIISDAASPLLDRAISGTYPPGSTFKLVTAAAGLQNNIIDSSFSIKDTGVLKVGDFSFANWYFTQYGKTDGDVNVVKAIQRSNDIFFYTVGQMVGVDRLSGFAKEFGLGSPLGLDLPGEASGLLPTKEWKEKVIGDKWYLGDDYHYGIGQGYLLTTPLQVNMWTQAIANAGVLYQPRLLKNTANTVSSPIRKNLLTKNTYELLREGMIDACSTGGVAWPFFQFKVTNEKLKIDEKDFYTPENATGSAEVGVRVACKTGTAQHGDDTTLPHAWITLFAPAYNPQVVVTVLAESSGEGSNIAGPIAKQILEKYFEK